MIDTVMTTDVPLPNWDGTLALVPFIGSMRLLHPTGDAYAALTAVEFEDQQPDSPSSMTSTCWFRYVRLIHQAIYILYDI